MRKWLYILVGLIFTIKGFGQVYHPIPTDSVYWVEESDGPYMGGYCIQFYYKYIYPTTNTINIAGNNYTEFRHDLKAEFMQFSPPPNTCPANYFQPNLFYAFIRNDSLNKKVFIYDTNYTHQEVLLYDFDISVGDTVIPVNGNGPVCTNDTLTVQSIDSIDVGGEYRKYFEITFPGMGWGPIYLIEGIGSSIGFADLIYCPFEYGTSLICFHHKNFQYGAVSDNHCTPYLAISEIQSTQFVYPTQYNSFYIKNPENNLIQILCYDVLGKFILEKSFHESGYLDFTEVPSGIYFMDIVYNGQPLKPYKFIVQH